MLLPRYAGVWHIRAESSRVSQTMYLLSNYTTFSHTEFDSCLTVDEGIQIHLISRRSKKKLLRETQRISSDLRVEVRDSTMAQS